LPISSATLVGRIRERFPTVAVRDICDHSLLGSLGEIIASTAPKAQKIEPRHVTPVGAGTRLLQFSWQLPTMTLAATNWLAWLLFGSNIAAELGVDFAPRTSWPV